MKIIDHIGPMADGPNFADERLDLSAAKDNEVRETLNNCLSPTTTPITMMANTSVYIVVSSQIPTPVPSVIMPQQTAPTQQVVYEDISSDEGLSTATQDERDGIETMITYFPFKP